MKSNENSFTPFRLSTQIRLDLSSDDSVVSIRTTGFLTWSSLYRVMKNLSEVNRYQCLLTHLILRRDLTGNLTRI
ncbi:hypothetical protein LguiB_025506 [Lonicera macranthoides]